MALLCSINWARILVQIGHFVYAYLQATDLSNAQIPTKQVCQRHLKNARMKFRDPSFLGFAFSVIITIRTRPELSYSG
jgi:hypothetical protein